MKKLINILPLFIIGMLVSLSMTSCIDNDDDTNGLTENEIKTCIMTMSGSYSGKLYYFNKDIDKTKFPNQTDSIENMTVRFSYPESAFVIETVPVKLFFKQLKGHDDLKAAADDYGYTDIKVKYVPYYLKSKYIRYYNQPETISMNLFYGNVNHDIKIAFMQNSLGEWFDGQTHFQLFEAAIYDGYDSKGQPELLDGKALYNQGLSTEDAKDLIFEYVGKSK